MTRQLVSFPSGELTLRGFLFRPEGDGPFPALVWNHGSEQRPGSQDDLGEFYASAGYVLFVPHRRGHGRSPGEYMLGAVPRAGSRARAIERIIELHELALEDTLAAFDWLAQQSFVSRGRMAMSGVSHGGIQTVLAAEADVGAGAYLPFAPAAIAWPGNPELQDRLLRAVGSAKAPMFLLQAENDYSLGPSDALGEVLRRKGGLNLARVYPPYGQTPEAGHGEFACRGMDVWGEEVCGFLEAALGGASVATAA